MINGKETTGKIADASLLSKLTCVLPGVPVGLLRVTVQEVQRLMRTI